MMKRIEQIDENGCGTACVAILAGVSYEQALEHTRTRGCTNSKWLRIALRSYGIKLGKREALTGKTYSDLKNDGLLQATIRPIRNGESWGHWMVWDSGSQAIIDPSNKFISTRRARLTALFSRHSSTLIKLEIRKCEYDDTPVTIKLYLDRCG